eukprot:scaffold75408_cov31-Tisochrysis_lutea.AAC.3
MTQGFHRELRPTAKAKGCAPTALDGTRAMPSFGDPRGSAQGTSPLVTTALPPPHLRCAAAGQLQACRCATGGVGWRGQPRSLAPRPRLDTPCTST